MAAVRISKIFRLFYPILGLLIVLSNYSGCSKEDTATGTEESGKETEETSEETADTADEETAAPSIDTIPTVEEETGSAATAEEASETAPATDEETGTSVDIDETSPTEPSEEIATVSPSEITEETPTEEETGEESPSDEEAPAEHDEEETTEPGIRNAPAGSTACYNDKDDDGDKFPDYSDPSCLAGATVEADCANGLDDDADGKIDSADSGCVTAAGASGGKEGYYPDGDFGGDGIVVVDNDEEGATDKNGQDAIYAMAPDSKGRIVAVGRYTTSGTSDDFYQHTGSTDGATDMMVMRFLPDGTLDPSFGSGGVAKPGDGPKNEGAKGEAVAVDSQGRIVAAGYTYNNDWDGNTSDYDSKDLIIWRLDENGKLDTSCNNTGYFIYSIPGRSAAEAIQALAIDTSDGTDRIVAVGGSFDDSCSTSAGCNDFDLLLLRLTEKCQLDTSLVDPDLVNASGYPGGYLLAGDMQNIWAYDYGLALTVDAEGRYVVGGRSSHKDNGSNYEMALWRFKADGTPDTKFGDGNGWVMHSGLGYVGSNYTDEARGVAVDSAGNIVAAGYTTEADFSTDVAVWRYTKDGVLDAGFGDGDGFVTYNSNITDWAYAVAVDPSDRIVVGGGLSVSASDIDLFVMRLKNNGGLDATFSSDGIVTHAATAGCNGIEKAYTVVADGGEIFAGGTGLNCGSKGDSTLLKITGEGALDTLFDAEGVASTEGYRESYQEYGQAVAQNTETGKIYLAGYQKASTGYSDMAIWGFNADGTPDASFGTDGVLTTTADFADQNRWTATHDDFIQGAAIDSKGKIVAAGYSTWAAGFNPMLVVWRFNADGTLDSTFSDDGYYWGTYSASNGDQKGHAVIVDASNNIVVAG
ncbi:MAG: hypothetical protein HYU99_05680, partial [Deltaproteobacteria bacterium]|nr:hypothetical protein [Deltaproteobacteria bacterium]